MRMSDRPFDNGNAIQMRFIASFLLCGGVSLRKLGSLWKFIFGMTSFEEQDRKSVRN